MGANLGTIPTLDGPRLRARRLELRIAETALARSIGVSPMVLRRIETNGAGINYDLRFLARYAAALGIDTLDLFDTGPPSHDTEPDTTGDGDVERVGAVLAGSFGRVEIDALAEALGWSVERCRFALGVLEERLAGCGIRVLFGADAEVVLVPAAGEHEAVLAHGDRTVGLTGLSLREAALVAQLVEVGPSQKAGDRNTQRRLVNLGIVENVRVRPTTAQTAQSSPGPMQVRLTRQARFDLGLD